MAQTAQIVELPGPDVQLSLALRLRTQGNLVDAAFWAATAAQTAGAAFFEANALAAALAAQLGRTTLALEYWDKIARSAPQKLVWLEAAIRFALGRPEAEAYLSRWLRLLLNVYAATPTPATLALLTANGHACPGCVGIYAGRLRGWFWLPKGRPTRMQCEGAKNFQVVMRPKGASPTHILYEAAEELPKNPCLIAIRDAEGAHIPGSPVICSPPCLKPGKKGSDLTVIIPAYDDYRATLACIGSLLASLKKNRIRPHILVAWDMGPNARLLAKLRRLAARGRLELVENRTNLGFLASVNNALSRTGRGDIVLLNADTIVHGDWLDRMAGAAQAPACATVTALGNEAELMSWPAPRDRGKVATLSATAILDRAASALPPAEAVIEIPVGVGFCMLITRQALARTGGLDGRSLCRGYGEEVDFCLRAREAGLKNYGAFNVFVAHLGERSFGAGKKALAAQNNAVIFERFPAYRRDYEQFVLSMPPRRLREKISLALLPHLPELPLLEIRPWSARFLPPWAKDEQCGQSRQGAALFLRPGPKPRALLRVWADLPVMEMDFLLPEDRARLGVALAALRSRKTFACTASRAVLALAAALGLSWEQPPAQGDLPPVWDGAGCRVLAAPPLSMRACKQLCELAKQNPDKIFYVFYIDSLWPGAPLPENVLETPRLKDYGALKPDVFIMPDNPADAWGWGQWLAGHGCAALPVRALKEAACD